MASVHALLLDLPDVRASVFTFLHEIGPEAQVSQILGSWCLSAWDMDRGVAARGLKSWKNAIIVRPIDSDDNHSEHNDGLRFVLDDSTLARYILPFTTMAISDPSSVFSDLNISSSVVSGDSASSSHLGTHRPSSHRPSGTPHDSIRRGLSGEEPTSMISREDDPESVEDRNARLRVAAMGALTWIFGTFH